MACVRIPLREEEGGKTLSTTFELNTVGSNVQTLFIDIIMYNCINGIMVTAIDYSWVNPIQLVFVASSLNMQY